VRERVRSKSIVAVTNGKKSISEQIPQTFRQPSSSTSFDRSKIVAINEDMSHNSYNGEDVEDSVRAQSTTATAALVDIEDCGDMTAYGV